ncbi:MAG: uracil-DNA glycosylase [Candidatus Pacebacteria bacterium]|nr:uracil-DNA glycosylase [Candidatus Paceibacterota bacterium]
MSSVRIHPSWKEQLATEFAQPYFHELSTFVRNEYETKVVFPSPKNVFRAFDLCPFNEVKVVILGQDPYHGPKQAHGLSFSVEGGVRNPPSLQNIFKEIAADVGHPVNQDGDLTRWAQQGVLLINATLTVRRGEAGSHQGKGWEAFTDAAIQVLSEKREHIVFLLWGNYARHKKELIDTRKHVVLEAAHPSPFSAHSGFFGCKHFSRANGHLQEWGMVPIEW